jgi:hypothetical protein
MATIEEKFATLEKEVKQLQRAQDYCDIQNVFALHEYYHHIPTEEVDMIFAQKQPDVSYSQNFGEWVGLKSIKNYYKTESQDEQQKKLAEIRKWHPDIPDDIKYAQAGYMGIHMLTTPIIEVAGDRQTAKGMWYTPGYMTFFDSKTGKWDTLWMFEKYAIDFIREDGKWKIWHFGVFMDFSCAYNKSWVEVAEQARLTNNPPFTPPAKPDMPSPGFNTYSTRGIWQMPKPPVPYRTFSETFSYGPGKRELISGSLD